MTEKRRCIHGRTEAQICAKCNAEWDAMTTDVAAAIATGIREGLAAESARREGERCEWRVECDDRGDYYLMGCEREIMLECEDAAEDHPTFCPDCGKRIEIKEGDDAIRSD